MVVFLRNDVTTCGHLIHDRRTLIAKGPAVASAALGRHR